MLDEGERRAVMSRCYLAQKCSDEMDSTVLEISSEKKDLNVFNEDDVSDEQTDEQEMSKALSYNRERSHDLSTASSQALVSILLSLAVTLDEVQSIVPVSVTASHCFMLHLLLSDAGCSFILPNRNAISITVLKIPQRS